MTIAEKRSHESGNRLRIGYLSTMYHTSLLIKGRRWVEEIGFEPEWSLFGTGPAIINEFSRGNLDIGYIGLAPTAIGIGKGVHVKCIAGGHVEGTVIAAKGQYKALSDFSGDMKETLGQFRGKKIGVPRRGSLHDVFLRYYLSQSGLDKEVQVVNYDWADFIPDAMGKNEIDAATGTPPLAVLLSRLFGARIVIPPQHIWPHNPSYGIVTGDEMLKAKRNLLERFLDIHKRACAMIREHPREASETVSTTVRLVDQKFVMDTYRVSPKYCASLSPEYVDSTMKLTSVLMDLGYLTRKLKENDIFDFDLIRKIHPEPPHYSSQISLA